MQRLCVRILLLCLLVGTVRAEPISFQQIRQDVSQSATQAASQQPAQAPANPAQAGETRDGQTQEGAPPQFVRLPDGRIVPYGPGTICRVESEEMAERIDEPGHRKWLLAAVPLVAAGVVCAVLCRGGSRRTAVSSSGQVPVTPLPPAEPVPEPGTLVLLGLGLAVFAQFGLGRKQVQSK
jgi:hypothetical protein